MRLAALFLALLLLVPASAGAQVPTGVTGISITLNPTRPRPYDTVTISVASTLINLPASLITITVDGVEVGEGDRTATIRMGGPGTSRTIRATAEFDGQTYTAQRVITPAEVALIMEADSTAHPFYDGAKLVPSKGGVRFVAVPDFRTAPGTRIPASELVYTWKLGDKTLSEQSGIGRSVLVATAPVRYRDAEVSVTVATRSGSLTAQDSVTVSPIDPFVRIYRDDPLSGTWFTRALSGTFALPGAEETFTAVPYFFAKQPSFEWVLNGVPSGSGKDVTVRSSGGAGTAVLGISAQHAETQGAASLSLRFGEERGVGIFGL